MISDIRLFVRLAHSEDLIHTDSINPRREYEYFYIHESNLFVHTKCGFNLCHVVNPSLDLRDNFFPSIFLSGGLKKKENPFQGIVSRMSRIVNSVKLAVL